MAAAAKGEPRMPGAHLVSAQLAYTTDISPTPSLPAAHGRAHACTCALNAHTYMHTQYAHTGAHSLLGEVKGTPGAGESHRHGARPPVLMQPFGHTWPIEKLASM